jgi:hypothetical protein
MKAVVLPAIRRTPTQLHRNQGALRSLALIAVRGSKKDGEIGSDACFQCLAFLNEIGRPKRATRRTDTGSLQYKASLVVDEALADFG